MKYRWLPRGKFSCLEINECQIKHYLFYLPVNRPFFKCLFTLCKKQTLCILYQYYPISSKVVVYPHWHKSSAIAVKLCKFIMMTSSNGNIFRVTGALCGEFTGHRWIPHTKASAAELWCFLLSAPWINRWVNNREAGDLKRHIAHNDVILMYSTLGQDLDRALAWEILLVK